VPVETLNDFLRASYVRQDGPDGEAVIFRLTTDGLAAAQVAAMAKRGISLGGNYQGVGLDEDQRGWDIHFVDNNGQIVVYGRAMAACSSHSRQARPGHRHWARDRQQRLVGRFGHSTRLGCCGRKQERV
jgi:hypothetical protein